MTREVGVVLPCAGIGRRLGADRPKQFLDLCGRPVFRWSLERFLSHPRVREVVLVVGRGEEENVRAMLPEVPSRLRFALGGEERWQSVRNGVRFLDAGCRLVLVHDVARPFVRDSDVDACLAALSEGEACTLAMPAVDTIKWARAESPVVSETLDRRRVWLTQTPQGFARPVLEGCYAHEGLESMGLTDEAGLCEALRHDVHLVPGGDHLRKITTPHDLEWARWWASREPG
jgi:2-C-methyl-D-erythritol 4-phosphate cytidylyltransferase